jgi:iron uptake system EfeUOB component EfeO/EfeM
MSRALYYQWSRARGGKTVSRRLNEAEAELYRSWIANRRRIEQIIVQMEQISAGASELLREAAPTKPTRTASR